MAAKDFVINRHGRLVFPSNAWPRLDFSVFTTVGQLSAAVSRDFEAKAPTASQIVAGLKSSRYPSRYEFLRDLGLHAFWVNRFAITMYDKRPTRWRDVPRDRAMSSCRCSLPGPSSTTAATSSRPPTRRSHPAGTRS